MKRPEFLKKLFLFLSIFIISVVYFFNLPEHPLHDDEHATTRRSPIIFQEYFSIPFKSTFDKQFWLSYIAYDHPILPYIIYGFVDTSVYRTGWNNLLESVNYNSNLPIMDYDYYGNGVWWTQCKDIANPLSCIPQEFHQAFNLIVLNRYLSVTLGILSLILVYKIGFKIGGFALGIVSEILLAIHHLFWYFSRVATLEIPNVFFELLIFYLLVKFLDGKKARNIPDLKKTLVISVCCGLVASSNLNGFMFPVIVSVVYLILHLNKSVKLREIFVLLSHVLIINFISFLVFFILNPFLWSDPYNNFVFMYQWKQSDVQLLMTTYPQAAFPELLQRPVMIINNLFTNHGCCATFKYFNWPELTGIFLFALGVIYLFKRKGVPSKILLIMFAGVFVSMSLYLRLNFDRYFLIIVPLIVMVQSAGLIFLISLVFRIRKLSIAQKFCNNRVN
jgi:4-amino-4-deoxy-L-arabinose transferase-like glycosyltransferase